MKALEAPSYVGTMTQPQGHLFPVPDPQPAESRVSGLWGLSRSGKTETAKILEAMGWARVSTSLIIGQVVAEGEGIHELLNEPLDTDLLDHFKQIIPGFHRKLVTYGDAIRRVAGEGVWSGATKIEVEKWLGRGYPVVWENVRTKTDYLALKALGGKLVEVRRDRESTSFSHLDRELMDASVYGRHYFLANNGTLDDLAVAVEQMVGDLYGARST